jgi:hypothetical protein
MIGIIIASLSPYLAKWNLLDYSIYFMAIMICLFSINFGIQDWGIFEEGILLPNNWIPWNKLTKVEIIPSGNNYSIIIINKYNSINSEKPKIKLSKDEVNKLNKLLLLKRIKIILPNQAQEPT